MADAAPWTIKGMPIEVRQKAVKAANAQDQTVAAWMTEAVNRLANQQAGNQVIPPGKPERPHAALPEIDLAGFAQAVAATVQAIQAAGGTPPKALGREAAATLRVHMRAARGLLPRAVNLGQTTPSDQANLQTIDGEIERPPQ